MRYEVVASRGMHMNSIPKRESITSAARAPLLLLARPRVGHLVSLRHVLSIKASTGGLIT